jgi:Na+-transporting NADH:ubiquinone oxidoreductase subunit NqrF
MNSTHLPSNSQYCFIPALSEPLPADAWEGEVGLITEVVQRRVPDMRHLEAYMCGPTAMIDAAITLLTTRGMNEGDIFYDKFVTKADTSCGPAWQATV